MRKEASRVNPSRANRGPAAAAENRAAILDAARRVFAERGYDVPLSTVVKEAGVSQGVFYRHFRTRLDLALAAFEDDWDAYEALADDPAPDAFERLWSLIVTKTIEQVAFVEMAIDARRSLVGYDGPDRLRALLARSLEHAHARGSVDPALGVEDVMLAQRMVYGVVVSTVAADDVRGEVARALALVPRLPRLPGLAALSGPSGGSVNR